MVTDRRYNSSADTTMFGVESQDKDGDHMIECTILKVLEQVYINCSLYINIRCC